MDENDSKLIKFHFRPNEASKMKMLSKVLTIFVIVFMVSYVARQVENRADSMTPLEPIASVFDDVLIPHLRIDCYDSTVAIDNSLKVSNPLLAAVYGEIRFIEINEKCSKNFSKLEPAPAMIYFNTGKCEIESGKNQIKLITEHHRTVGAFKCDLDNQKEYERLPIRRANGRLLGEKEMIKIGTKLIIDGLTKWTTCWVQFPGHVNNKDHVLLENGMLTPDLDPETIKISDERNGKLALNLIVNLDLLLLNKQQDPDAEFTKLRLKCRVNADWLAIRKRLIVVSHPKLGKPSPIIEATWFTWLLIVVAIFALSFLLGIGVWLYRKKVLVHPQVTSLAMEVIEPLVDRDIQQDPHQPPRDAEAQTESANMLRKRIITVRFAELFVLAAGQAFDLFQNLIQVFETWPFRRETPYALNTELTMDFERSEYHFLLTPRFTIRMDRLTMLGKLSQGSFGVVNAGQWRRDDRQEEVDVVIKRMRTDRRAATESLLADFCLEIGNNQLLAQCENTEGHENIVQFYGVVAELNEVWMVMERCDRCLLTFIQRRGRCGLPIQEISIGHQFEMLIQVAKGMNHLHVNGFLHRDLAARNCMLKGSLEEGFVVKIGDLGMTKPVDRNDHIYVRRSTRMDNVPIRHMAPEAISFNQYSCGSDVWSFGVLIYEVFTYGLPPPGHRMQPYHYLFWLQHNLIKLPDTVPNYQQINQFLESNCFQRFAYQRTSFASLGEKLQELQDQITG